MLLFKIGSPSLLGIFTLAGRDVFGTEYRVIA